MAEHDRTMENGRPMNVHDLTDVFIHKVLTDGDPSAYRSVFPALFDHYYTYWASPERYPEERTADFVAEKAELIRSRLPTIKQRFAALDITLEDIEVALFVGHNVSNGHAFQHKGKFITWIPVEAYPSLLSVDVFVSHEIAHGLHYFHAPDTYFTTKAEKNLMWRQLLTEGIATLVSMNVTDVDEVYALWADVIDRNQAQNWYTACREKRQELAQFALDHFSDAFQDNAFFSMCDAGDVFRNRSGYYLGLQLIKEIADTHGFGPVDLIKINDSQGQELLREQLGKEIS